MPDSPGVRAEVLMAEFLRITPESWRGTGFRSGFWRLYYHEEPGAAVLCGPGVEPAMQMAPGCAYLIPAGVSFGIGCSGELWHLYVHFDVSGISALSMAKFFGQAFQVPSDAALRPSLQRLWAILASERPCAPKARSQALAVSHEALALCLQALPDDEAEMIGAPNRRLEAVRPAVNRIRDSVGTHFAVGDLARECGMSREHFTKSFREAMGSTPVRYTHECRVRAAEQALLRTTKAIEQIAEDCGFGTREYFTRVFTRLRGCSPGAYRARCNI